MSDVLNEQLLALKVTMAGTGKRLEGYRVGGRRHQNTWRKYQELKTELLSTLRVDRVNL